MIVTKLDTNICKNKQGKVDAIIYLNNYELIDKLCNRASVVKEYPFINAIGVTGDYNNITTLTYLPYVDYICSVSKVYALDNTMAKASYSSKEKDNIEIYNYAKIVNNFFYDYAIDAKPVTVAVLDTGVSRHIDLCSIDNRIIKSVDLENKEINAYDDNGHGTFVAGIVAGNGIASAKKITGVCPKANIVSVKIMNEKGESTVFQVLDGMQWIMDNKDKYGIKVVCMSFGALPLLKNDPLVKGVNALVDGGISVVCASGNSGENTFMSPAISNKVISVGAVDGDLKIADFTSRGKYQNKTYPDLYAKGVEIEGLSNTHTYVMMSGTSVACPVVAGFIALMYLDNPDLSPKDVKDNLTRYCKIENNYLVLDL